MAMVEKPLVAVFGSDKGPGDAERAAIMSQAGGHFVRRGARLLCLAENGALPVPLLTAATVAGGEVTIVADETIVLPPALGGLPIERIEGAPERIARVAALADGFVGLPGSLQSAGRLFTVWTAAGGGASRKPVVLLNRNRAFEVMRGFAADVISHSVRNHDRVVQFSDNVEDCWNRLARMLGQAAH